MFKKSLGTLGSLWIGDSGISVNSLFLFYKHVSFFFRLQRDESFEKRQ